MCIFFIKKSQEKKSIKIHPKTKPSLFTPPSKPLTLQFSCLNSSVSLSLAAPTHRSPLVTFVAQTSDWAQQEEEQSLAETEAGLESWEPNGEDAGDESFVEPPEEAKLFVGNLPYDVDSQKLAMLFEQAGTVEIAEVRNKEREALYLLVFQFEFMLMLLC